jgi:hypothetical protein
VANKVSFGSVQYTAAAGLFYSSFSTLLSIEFLFVGAGLFKENSAFETQMHCHYESRVPWADCSADGKPAFAQFPSESDVF